MTQHLNFVHTCEFFAMLSFGFASVYYLFGHYPTTKVKIVEMEEVKEEKPQKYDNELQLDSVRSSEADTQRDKFRGTHKQLFNETVETLDNE